MANAVELKPGTMVRFLNGETIERGIINGDVWAMWDGRNATSCFVPVHVGATNRNYQVALDNVVAAAAIELEHSVKV